MDFIKARKIFNNISTTQLCDAAKNIRIIKNSIRPFINKPKMLGKAFTVKTDGDLLSVIKSLQLATEDNVIVIESSNSEFALAGEIFASEAKRKKIAGIVIDGFCRDADSIGEIGLPLFAKGTCPKAGSKNKIGQLNISIQCGGITISPNDIIIGDEHGIIILNEEELWDALTQAEKIIKREEIILQKINSGTSIMEMLNFTEHYDNVAAGKESTLQWKIE